MDWKGLTLALNMVVTALMGANRVPRLSKAVCRLIPIFISEKPFFLVNR